MNGYDIDIIISQINNIMDYSEKHIQRNLQISKKKVVKITSNIKQVTLNAGLFEKKVMVKQLDFV